MSRSVFRRCQFVWLLLVFASIASELCYPTEAHAAPAAATESRAAPEAPADVGEPSTGASDEKAPSDSSTAVPRAVSESELPPEVDAAETEGDSPETQVTADSDEQIAADEETGDSPEGSGESDVVVDTGSGLFEQSLATDDAAVSGDGAEGVASALGSFELNGYVRGDMFVGKVPGFAQGEIKAGYGELALQLRSKKGSFGAAYAETRFRFGQQGDVRDLIVDLREAYVDAYWGKLDLRFGHQIVVWGRADAFNPTNNLTPFDLRVRSPIEDDRRVGNVGARLNYNLSPIRLEGVWMPLYSPVEYPQVTVPEFVTLDEPNFPNPELVKGLVAARVHLELPAVEMSASYLHGYAPLPGLAFTGFSVGEEAEVRIARTAYNHHVVGFDFSTAIGDELALRGEAAYRSPIKYEQRSYAPNPDLQYVVGIDRAFGPVSVIAQYAGRYTFDWQEATVPEDAIDPSALEEIDTVTPLIEDTVASSVGARLAERNQALFQQLAEIQHIASLRFEWLTLHDTLSLSSLGLFNFTTKEWLLYPKLEYRITDGMSTYVGGEIYAGPDDTLLGLIDEALSAGYVELRIGF